MGVVRTEDDFGSLEDIFAEVGSVRLATQPIVGDRKVVEALKGLGALRSLPSRTESCASVLEDVAARSYKPRPM